MNDRMRKTAWERITDPKARKVYDALCEACEARAGGMTDPDQMLIEDVAFLEQMKEMLREDIAKRGIGQERRNGRQTYWADNKSLAHYRASCESQRKLMSELRLTPNARKAEQVVVNDDFDEFPD